MLQCQNSKFKKKKKIRNEHKVLIFQVLAFNLSSIPSNATTNLSLSPELISEGKSRMPLSTCWIPFIHGPDFANEAIKDKDMVSGLTSFFEQYRFGPWSQHLLWLFYSHYMGCTVTTPCLLRDTFDHVFHNASVK